MINKKMKLKIDAVSQNESFARNVIALFVLDLNPNISEISDIKTAVSEAVTNCIVHAYNNSNGEIEIDAEIFENELHINILDYGIGIENVDKALQPFYTTKSTEERSGMGFTIMKNFMDKIEVSSKVGKGTNVFMCKKISSVG